MATFTLIAALSKAAFSLRSSGWRGVACITWHKNFNGEDWPRDAFGTCVVPIHGPAETGSATVRLAEKRIRLRTGLEVRQIRRLLDNGRQVPLITTHPAMPMEEVAGSMFSRWSQENFFKYMRDAFNLDALPDHALEPIDPDARVVNPARRTVEKTIVTVRSRLKSLHLRIVRATKKGRPIDDLVAGVGALDEELEAFKEQRKDLPRHVRAGDLPENQRLDALPVARRLLLDVIRMMPPVIEAQGKKSNARKLLAALMTADANILPDPGNGILRVQILGLARNAVDQALLPLIDELNQTETVCPGTSLRLVYEMAGTSPHNEVT